MPGVKFVQTGVSIYDSNNIQSFSTIKFIAKSQYFRKGFSKTGDYRSSSTLELPETLNVSSMKVLQSDRKITTTELDDTISPINKLPLPGDISTNSSEDLNYLFWSPISDYENMYLSNYSKVQTAKAGTTVNIQLPASDFGGV